MIPAETLRITLPESPSGYPAGVARVPYVFTAC